jgi:glutaredoxin-related protein
MESDIRAWIVERLSVSLPNFNNMPACPFAKQALTDQKVKITNVLNNTEFVETMKQYANAWPGNVEVLVLGCDPKLITSEELSTLVEDANMTFLKDNGLLALEDHPSDLEYAAGYHVNEGNWALVLLQSKEKIVSARKILERRGYYKNWDQEYYKEVVLDRS